MSNVRTPITGNRADTITVEGGFGRYTALGFRSASLANREGRSYSLGSGDSHSRYDRPRLIDQSRDFYRNNAIYKGIIDRAVGYIHAGGFQLQVKTDNPAFNKKVESLWRDHNKRPEIRGLLNGMETGDMFIRETLLCGDVGAIKTNKGIIQLVEAEQIAGNQTKDGIEKNMFNVPMRYFVSSYNDYGQLSSKSARPINPADFIFMTCPDRPSSTRGVPALQSSFPMLHRINDVCDSEAIAMQLLARLAVSVTRDAGEQLAYTESKEDPNKSGTDTTGQLGARLMELEYALMFHGKPGDKIEGIDHNIPGKNFGESLRMFLRILGLPLGMPLEIVLLDWTRSNYSQSRAVLEQAYQSFNKWQSKLEDFYYIPHIDWKMAAWRKAGLFGNRKEIPYSLIKPTFPWIDQLKETQAKGEMVERSMMTHSEACMSRGLDREEVVEIREREIRDAIDKAKKIKTDTGIDVAWQHFAGLSAPKNEVVLNTAKEKRPDDEDDSKETSDA